MENVRQEGLCSLSTPADKPSEEQRPQQFSTLGLRYSSCSPGAPLLCAPSHRGTCVVDTRDLTPGGVLRATDHPVVLLGTGLGLGGGGGPRGPVRVHAELLGQVHVASLGGGVALATEPREALPAPVVDAHLDMVIDVTRGRTPRGRTEMELYIKIYIYNRGVGFITMKCQLWKRSYTRWFCDKHIKETGDESA